VLIVHLLQGLAIDSDAEIGQLSVIQKLRALWAVVIPGANVMINTRFYQVAIRSSILYSNLMHFIFIMNYVK
jgi:hypothetical protein